MSIVQSPTGNTTPASAISQSTDWRTAVTDLVAWMVANDRCFSSGEIAAYLRTYRSDLAFRVSGIGDQIRDAYDNNTFPSYDDGQGNVLYPTRVPRTSAGIARTLDGRTVTTKTPVGQTVFVYAKDGSDGFAHDFEIYIPDYDDPQGTRAVDYTGPAPVQAQIISTPSQTPGAAPVVSAPPTPAMGVLITGTLSKDDQTAYVRPDRRLCVPRAAFEVWVNLTGQPLRGGQNGDPVYVTVDGLKVIITRESTPTSQEYHLWRNNGRIAVDKTPAVTPGEKFKITVTAADLTIDLTAKV